MGPASCDTKVHRCACRHKGGKTHKKKTSIAEVTESVRDAGTSPVPERAEPTMLEAATPAAGEGNPTENAELKAETTAAAAEAGGETPSA